MLDENGDVIMEEKEIRIPMFRPTTVFDVAQTEGKPLPERVANPVATLTGDVEHYEMFMEALRRSLSVPVKWMRILTAISAVPIRKSCTGRV